MKRITCAAFAAGLIGFTLVAMGDPSPFAFTTNTYPEGQGNWELEQYVTWKHHKNDEPGYERFDVQHELEYGLTDNVDIAFYLANWRYEDTASHTGMEYKSSGFETKIYLTNPAIDPVGIGLYGEMLVGPDEVEFEQKLLVQKDWDNWIFAYNLALETEVEGIFDTRTENELEGTLKHTFGVSYAAGPHWLLGGEAIIESVYADWSDYQGTTVWAGPAIGYQSGDNWWVTLAATYQLTDQDDEPNFMTRLKFGYNF